jgi:hypothetical protein
LKRLYIYFYVVFLFLIYALFIVQAIELKIEFKVKGLVWEKIDCKLVYCLWSQNGLLLCLVLSYELTICECFKLQVGY